jgi:hypothetical protein
MRLLLAVRSDFSALLRPGIITLSMRSLSPPGVNRRSLIHKSRATVGDATPGFGKLENLSCGIRAGPTSGHNDLLAVSDQNPARDSGKVGTPDRSAGLPVPVGPVIE